MTVRRPPHRSAAMLRRVIRITGFDRPGAIPYNPQSLPAARSPAISEMFIAVGLQAATVALLALGAGIWFDWTSAKFLVLGGAAAIIPNGLFALRLASHRGKPAESYPAVFFLGEFAKIGLTTALIALVAGSFESVRWLALLVGLIAALKAPLFALLWAHERPGPGDTVRDADGGAGSDAVAGGSNKN
jgi:ATP synthase protein I